MNAENDFFIPSNISTLNEHTFKPNDPDVLIDEQKRQYRPLEFLQDINQWMYHCRINPKQDIDYPNIGDTIILKYNGRNQNIQCVGIVEETFFKRPTQKSYYSDVKRYISSTVGTVILRKHPKFNKPISQWH
jgi:hypothetical protein